MRRWASAVGMIAGIGLAAPVAGATVGDWSYRTEGSFFAATSDDGGNLFGQWCSGKDGGCHYLMALPVRCIEGERYVTLANSDSSANAVEIECRGALEGRNEQGRALYRYVFTNFSSIDHQVRHSRGIGLAFPLEGDRFIVARFSLAGALQAITAMRGAAERALPAQRQGRAAPNRQQ
jgi:hypothetical protein